MIEEAPVRGVVVIVHGAAIENGGLKQSRDIVRQDRGGLASSIRAVEGEFVRRVEDRNPIVRVIFKKDSSLKTKVEK